MRDPRWGMEKNHLHVGALILWMSHKFKGMATDCAESITELPQGRKKNEIYFQQINSIVSLLFLMIHTQ